MVSTALFVCNVLKLFLFLNPFQLISSSTFDCVFTVFLLFLPLLRENVVTE